MTPIETDALVIGAGPVGLYQVFQLGLQGLRCEVIDTLSQAGGQCIELYADKPIYDIPALPVCTGAELIDRLLQQTRPFAPGFHFNQQVEGLSLRPDGRFDVLTSTGADFVARVVFVAAGVGAFLPRGLKVPGADEAIGQGWLSHREPAMEDGRTVRDRPPAATDAITVVHGGDDRALSWALSLADAGRPVALLYRRDTYPASDALVGRIRSRADAGTLTRLTGQPSAVRIADGALQVDYTDGQGASRSVAAQHLHVSLGLSPRLGPLADWGLALERKQVAVDTARFETAVPGVYAVGDITSYAGKLRLIACGFHEATLAAHAAARRLHPDEPVPPLEYTTSSKRLQQRLGVWPNGGL